MRVPDALHRSQRWVIDEIAPDFDLLDVWAVPVEGGEGDFDRFLEVMASIDPVTSESRTARVLFEVRFRLGSWLGWDRPAPRPIPGCAETTLRARLPGALLGSAARFPSVADAMQQAAGGFDPLYRTDHEAAAEISNATVHGILHLSWVHQGGDGYRPHLAVYVKPRGTLGRVYLRCIDPFRHLVVYPALMRQIGRAWDARRGATSAQEG